MTAGSTKTQPAERRAVARPPRSRATTRRLKALLFDVDGTLADTEQQGHLPSYNEAFRELGLDWHWSEALYRDELLRSPGGRERIRHYVETHRPPLGAHEEAAGQDLGEWVNQVHARKAEGFTRRVVSGEVTLRPGVRRLIDEAFERGVRLAIVTNASRRSLAPFLDHTLGRELLAKMDFIVSGEQVEHKKPFPDLYRRAVELLDVETSECLAIEDSEMGVQAAAAAGVPALVTTNVDTLHHDFSRALAVVDGLGEPGEPWHVSRGGLPAGAWATPDVLDELLLSA